MSRVKTGIVVAAALLAAGCAKKGIDPALEREANLPMAAASLKLAESSSRAAKAQEELVRIQAARTEPAPAPVDETLSGVPAELRRPTTLQWSGPGKEAARQIAEIIGYQFRVMGNPPATEPMVNVSHDGAPAVKALEDLGNQSQPFAQIVVDPQLKRLEYRYLVTGSRGAAARGRAAMSK